MTLRTMPWFVGLAALLLTTGAASAAVELRGEMKQGALVVGETEPGATVRFDGNEVRVSSEGHFVIGFERDAPRTQRLEVVLPDGERVERALEIASREYYIQRIDGVPPEQVFPPEEALPQIRRDIQMIRAARLRDDPRTDFLVDFIWPAEGRITGVYGSQRFYNGEPRRPHYGLDIANDVGTPIRAAAAGVISVAQPDMYFNGATVVIDHGHGVSTLYLHLNDIDVEVGDRVDQGEIIGEMGATGRVTGPHLHWEVNWLGRRLDPELLVDGTP